MHGSIGGESGPTPNPDESGRVPYSRSIASMTRRRLLQAGAVAALLAVLAAGLLFPDAVGRLLGAKEAPSDAFGARVVVPPTLRSPAPPPGESAVAAPADDPDPPPIPALPPPVDLDALDRETVLGGVVVDEEGKPVPGASVHASSWRRIVDPATGISKSDPVPRGDARTAADGTFALQLDWGAGVTLLAEAEGFAPANMDDRPAGARVRIVMRRGRPVVVRAVDPEGAPVDGATVALGSGTIDEPQRFRETGTTAAGAGARFAAVPPGTAEVVIEHPSFGDFGYREFEVPPGGDDLVVSFTLDPGRVVEGTVVDAETGGPVPGARVGRGWTLLRAVTADADGRFRFAGWNRVPGWDYGLLQCIARGYTSAKADVPAAGPVEFRLVRGDRVTGRVLAPGGAPVAGARVSLRGWGPRGEDGHREQDLLAAATDAEGRFSIEGVRRDLDSTVEVIAEGRPELEAPVPHAAGAPGLVDLGDLRLIEGKRVSGVVLDSAGRPATDLDVHIEGGAGRRRDDAGRFRLIAVPPGHRRLWVVRPDAYPLLETEIDVPADRDLTGVELRLPAFHRIVVKVVDAAGTPLRGVVVYASGENDFDWKATGEDGRADLDQLKDALVNLQAEWEDGNGEPLGLPVFPEDEVRAGGQEIVLVMERGVLLEGRVLDGEGRPAAAVAVSASTDGGWEGWGGRTGPDGRFRFRVPGAGPWIIEATKRNGEGGILARGTAGEAVFAPGEVEIRIAPVPEEIPAPAPR